MQKGATPSELARSTQMEEGNYPGVEGNCGDKSGKIEIFRTREVWKQ